MAGGGQVSRDELGNLQWLTIAEHREKTKVEVKLCRSHKRVVQGATR